MPLHGENPPVVETLDSLDDSVRRDSRDAQAVPQPVDGLMVQRIDLEPSSAGCQRENGVFLDLHRMDGLISRVISVVLERAGALRGDVLNQAAPRLNVEHLNASAYRQDRHAQPARGGDERDLRRVASLTHCSEVGVPLLAEIFRRDVLSAGQDEAIDAREDTLGGQWIGQGRHHEWYEPCVLDSGDVRRVQSNPPLSFIPDGCCDRYNWPSVQELVSW